MGVETGISWTDHTWNGWRGCDKISPGCDHCYAWVWSKRNPLTLGKWGPDGFRTVAAESYWRLPEKWNAAAKEAGIRRKVFALSLGDMFEHWRGHVHDTNGNVMWWCDGRLLRAGETSVGLDQDERTATLGDVRDRVFGLIAATPWLDWLILTKRPERMLRYFQRRNHWGAAAAYRDLVYGPDSDVGLGDGLADWPTENVWAGVSVEDRPRLADRHPVLRRVPAAVRFLSVEPLLEDLGRLDLTGIDWVIVGGESGPGHRPMDLDWARSIRNQCLAAGVPFFFKQSSGARPGTGAELDGEVIQEFPRVRAEGRV